MLFPTATFAVFFLIVLPVSWLLMPSQRAWRAWILLASYVFYGWWDWRFVFLLVASTVVNHVLALAIYRARAARWRKAFLTLAVGFDLGFLAYFKYAGFFVSSFDNAFGTSWIVPLTPMTSAAFMVFTLYMIPDPATTPVQPLRQALFAVAIAAVYGMLLVNHVVYGLFIALTIVCALRGAGLYAWAAWQFIRANQRGPLILQPGMAGTAKGMSAC